MVSRNSSLDETKGLVKKCLSQLYAEDTFILERNNGKGVCERSIVFRFAHYLQNGIPNYFVDCDFNSSFENYIDSRGNTAGRERHGKPIENEDGSVTKRFVDIIVHKRDYSTRTQNDLVCFEIKKWNNTNPGEINKDKNNLRVMTSRYGYIYGFYISIHKVKTKTQWIIFRNGRPLGQEAKVFERSST
jgi:hypothetical protein